jgi:hypothetical protein
MAVVRDYWKTNEQAAMHHDASLFAQIQTGLIQEADEASIKADLALGSPDLAAPRPLRHVTVYVPHQYRYPAEFLALIETVQTDETAHPTNDPWSFYDHFSQASTRDPWKADFYADVRPSRTPKFALDRAGYATAIPAGASRFVRRPEGLAAALSTYLHTGVESGVLNGPFAPGPLTTESVNLQRAHSDNMTRLGYHEATDFEVLPYVHSYQAADGSAIVLFALRPSTTVTLPDPSTCIVQPASPRQWGGLVPIGRYTSVTIDNLLQYIGTDPLARSGAQVDVVGVGDNQVAARTVPSPLTYCH